MELRKVFTEIMELIDVELEQANDDLSSMSTGRYKHDYTFKPINITKTRMRHDTWQQLIGKKWELKIAYDMMRQRMESDKWTLQKKTS